MQAVWQTTAVLYLQSSPFSFFWVIKQLNYRNIVSMVDSEEDMTMLHMYIYIKAI